MTAVDQLKDLCQKSPPVSPKQDKLHQSKVVAREIHDTIKSEQAHEKQRREERYEETVKERQHARAGHDTWRAHKDERDHAKKEHHQQTGKACEHGVWRCKICFPHHDK